MVNVELNKQNRLSEHLASPNEAALGHSSKLDGSRLSPHFTLKELCKTSVNSLDGNIPGKEEIENLKRLCPWLEELRYRYNRRYVSLPLQGEMEEVTKQQKERPPLTPPVGGGSEEEGVRKEEGALGLPLATEGTQEYSKCGNGGGSSSSPESGEDRRGLKERLFRPPLTEDCSIKTQSPNLGGEEEPIVISSGYRSETVNRCVGGAYSSNHLTGCAVDIRCAGVEQAIRYAAILLDIADEWKQDYDELLIERNRHGRYWVHFAVRPLEEGNRRKVMFLQK